MANLNGISNPGVRLSTVYFTLFYLRCNRTSYKRKQIANSTKFCLAKVELPFPLQQLLGQSVVICKLQRTVDLQCRLKNSCQLTQLVQIITFANKIVQATVLEKP